jgi:hypothetical protein
MQKQKIQRVVDALPDDVDVDALVEKLFLLHKLDAAEKELAERQRGTVDDKRRRVQWLA